MRAGKYLGHTKQAKLPLRANGAAAFARLDYRVSKLSVKAADSTRGSAIPLAVDLSCTGKSSPGRHVVRVQFVTPDGKAHDFYTQNVDTRGGQWRGQVVTALNDPPGLWTIRAREIISGKTATTQFQLK